MMGKIKKVYIASPLFNPPEREENSEIDEAIRKEGFETFLPQRDGFLYVELVKTVENREKCRREDAEKIALRLITHLDIYQVCEGTDALVLNMNGRVPDEGAVSEAAMAFAVGHPVVIYKNDARSLVGGKDNPLVAGLSGCEIVNTVEGIPAALKKLEDKPFRRRSDYSEMMGVARELFRDYDPKNKNLDALIDSGKNHFIVDGGKQQRGTKQKRVFIVCPVRGIEEEGKQFLQDYVSKLESQGHSVHYPPRDTKQDDPVGLRICSDNREAIEKSDEVHVYWSGKSEGTKFDLGMAFSEGKPVVLINRDKVESTPYKSFQNVLLELDSKYREKTEVSKNGKNR